jgi:acetylornithine/succinyldiaminopimelate/putrescine aminotransferase
LAIAIEFNDDKYVSEVAEKCKDKGLILSTSNNKIITIFPALNIDIKTTEKGLRILQNCV